MKLSEAIQVGAKIRPQGFGALQTANHRLSWRCFLGVCKPEPATCALAAAFEAADCGSHTGVDTGSENFRGEPGKVGVTVTYVDTPREWHAVLWYKTECPQCEKPDTTQRLIAHLNDDHKWLREEIALWVERIERQVDWLRLDAESRVIGTEVASVDGSKAVRVWSITGMPNLTLLALAVLVIAVGNVR